MSITHSNSQQIRRSSRESVFPWIQPWRLKSSFVIILKVAKFTHTHLKELLDDIISKDIHHELVGRLQYLTEDKLALRWTGSLQFQLDKPLRDREDEPDILY